MQSSSEINTISKRAVKASGYTWGIAEDVGKSISSIEMFGIAGVKNLTSYLKLIRNNIWSQKSDISISNVSIHESS